MNGGAGEGGGQDTGGVGDDAHGLKDVFGYLENVGVNGIAIIGILVWIDIQQKSTPENVWMARVDAHFNDHEIDLARSSLWKASKDNKEIIGEMIIHKNPGKKQRNLLDIQKAMMQLKEKMKLPLLMSTSQMMKRCPAFHCDKENANDVDVMAKVKVLEQSMDSFMKQQGEQMRNLTETMGNLCQTRSAPTPPPPVEARVRSLRKYDSAGRERSVSPS